MNIVASDPAAAADPLARWVAFIALAIAAGSLIVQGLTFRRERVDIVVRVNPDDSGATWWRVLPRPLPNYYIGEDLWIQIRASNRGPVAGQVIRGWWEVASEEGWYAPPHETRNRDAIGSETEVLPPPLVVAGKGSTEWVTRPPSWDFGDHDPRSGKAYRMRYVLALGDESRVRSRWIICTRT